MPKFALVWAQTGMGNRDNAFARLEKAAAEREDRMVWVKVDPLLAPLRSDPRFKTSRGG
jgi:hypothetical protein